MVDDVSEPLLKGKKKSRKLFSKHQLVPMQSLWYEFYMGIGIERLSLILLIILCLSLYVAYIVTGMSLEDRIPVEVDATRVEL